MQINQTKSTKENSPQKQSVPSVRKSGRVKRNLKKDSIQTQQKKQQKKLTTYFNANSLSTTSEVLSDPEDQQINHLKKELQDKDEQMNRIKTQKEVIENRYSRLFLQNKSYKVKAREMMIKNLKEEGERARAAKKKIDLKLGYFMDGNKIFVEGEDLVQLRKSVETLTDEYQKWNQQLRKCKSDDQKDRIKSAMSFIKKQLSLKQDQLASKRDQIEIYTRRLKLARQELNCYYSEKKWPIVKDLKGNDRYIVMQLLGQGGFGEVYKCFDLDEIDYVAIKINNVNLHKASAEEQKGFLKHVERQVKTQESLKHPNIAEIKEVLEINQNRIVFVLEYCQGPELSIYLKANKCIEQKDAKKIVQQIFSALNYLTEQEAKVIHYDLKPSNIMFHRGVVKVLDFGLCKLMESQDSRMELTSQGVGTYWYLPPETFSEFQSMITPKVDVWSAGVIFYEMLYGKRPFANGIAQTQIYEKDLITQMAKKWDFPIETPNRYRVSNEAKQFIRLCLTNNPDNRLSAHEAFNHPYFKS